MPWCPNCKNEYVDGIKECADCHVTLVEQLEEDFVPVIFGEEEEIYKLNTFLEANEFTKAIIRPSEEDNFFELVVPASLEKRVKQMISVYSMHKAKTEMTNLNHSDDEMESAESDENPLRPNQSTKSSYTTQKDKAENYKTSAYTLVSVGILGLVFLVMALIGMFPVRFGILTYLIMGGMFLLFLVSGIASYRSYKKSSQDAVMENHLSKEIMEWCKGNLNSSNIDQVFETEQIPDEVRYFKRIDRMKECIRETYLNLDEGFLDALVEEIYPAIYDESEGNI